MGVLMKYAYDTTQEKKQFSSNNEYNKKKSSDNRNIILDIIYWVKVG